MDAVLLDVAVPYLVNCCYNDFLHLRFLGEFVDVIFVCKVEPGFPLVFVGEVNVVVNCASVHYTRENLSAVELQKTINLTVANFFKEHVQWFAILSIDRTE